MDKHLKIAIELAKKAGAHQLKRLGGKHKIQYKVGTDFATNVDKECEELIVKGLAKKFKGYDVLAEEGSGHRLQAQRRWIIDPLDGTLNFSKGYPHFACGIALEDNGEIVLGVVFDPNSNELFYATKGGGAFLNGKRIKVSATNRVEKALLATGFVYNDDVKQREENICHFINFLKAASAFRRNGSALLCLTSVACGRFDGFWEMYLKPWDIAAGEIIVREAGGAVSMFCGNKLDIYGIEILASNKKIHKEMVEILGKCPTKK